VRGERDSPWAECEEIDDVNVSYRKKRAEESRIDLAGAVKGRLKRETELFRRGNPVAKRNAA